MAAPNRMFPQYALAYILGGKASLVLYSERTHAQYKFFIKQSPKANNVWYVYSDLFPQLVDERPYLGFIRDDTQHGMYFKAVEYLPPDIQIYLVSDQIKELLRSIKAFQWMIDRLIKNYKLIPNELHILHTGTCSACGRPLTDAESLERGLGPVCAGKR